MSVEIEEDLLQLEPISCAEVACIQLAQLSVFTELSGFRVSPTATLQHAFVIGGHSNESGVHDAILCVRDEDRYLWDHGPRTGDRP